MNAHVVETGGLASGSWRERESDPTNPVATGE